MLLLMCDYVLPWKETYLFSRCTCIRHGETPQIRVYRNNSQRLCKRWFNVVSLNINSKPFYNFFKFHSPLRRPLRKISILSSFVLFCFLRDVTGVYIVSWRKIDFNGWSVRLFSSTLYIDRHKFSTRLVPTCLVYLFADRTTSSRS